METLKKIWKWIKEHPTFILLIVAIVAIILLLNKCAGDAREDKINKQNIFALTDSLRIVKNKAGELEYQKGILVTDKKNLEKLNADLAAELEKEKDNVKIIIKEVVKFIHDTIYTKKDSIIYKGGGVYEVVWKYSDIKDSNNYFMLNGNSSIKVDTSKKDVKVTSLGTVIVPRIGTTVVHTISKEKGKLVMNTRFGYDGFQVTKMDGAVLDDFSEFKKHKRFGVGPQIGVGIGSNLKFVVYVGVGIHWDIFRF